MIRRSHSRRSGESLKRSGSPQSPPKPTKAPKVKHCKVIVEKMLKKDTPSTIVMMEKIEEKLTNYDSFNKDMKNALATNREAIDGLNSKLDKISQLLGVLTENGGKMNESNPESKIFYPFYGNVMTCESFFNMEGLMTNYGMTGKNVTAHIFSYLNFDSMVAARMVSKTWYQFLEDERSLWITLMKKCFEDIQEKRNQSNLDDTCSQDWQRLIKKVEKSEKNVADIVTLTQNLDYLEVSLCLPAQGLRSFESVLNLRYWQNFRYLKLLVKYDHLHGLRESYYASDGLISWSLVEMEALKFVMPILQKELILELKIYGRGFNNYGLCPLWVAIRQKKNGLENMKMLIPFATKKFWNSGKPIGSVDHTPLADAIMIGNVEMVKTIMPLTKWKANPKNRFGSYLHVAVRYGQFEIFKIIFKHLGRGKKFNWLKLKDQEERNFLELLQDESFRLENYDHDLEKPVRSDRYESENYKQHMLKFIENLM